MRPFLMVLLLGAGLLRAQEAAPEGRRLLPDDCTLPAASPHVAVGDDGTLLATFAADEEIWCSVSRDGGRSFRAPDRVGAAGLLESGLQRGPRGAVAPDTLAVLAVCGERLQGEDGNLLAWRSEDRGLTWKGPQRVNDVPDSAREGLHALAAGPDGQLVAVWLDLRTGGTELWCDVSPDGGATWGADVALYRSPDGSLCECCAPAVAIDPSTGHVVALWRNALGGTRDMWALVAGRGAQSVVLEAQELGRGDWPLQACPMAGGGAAFSARGELLTFWRRDVGLFTAAPGLGETEVAQGRETVVAAAPGGFRLAWTDAQGRVLTARALHLGGLQETRVLGRGVNVSVAGAPDGHGPVVAAWETGEGGPASLRLEVLEARREPPP